ncbi:aldehyde ferredoxin oxidoreductase family protein [candidate division KSB1 bacterium]|nr:aldehyde ferredoxin oxidoreductase family protein [candidate division KSB1 bacterium]
MADKSIPGCSNNVLDVNLSDLTFSIIKIDPADRQRYLGAKGLALKLLYDRMQPGIDPLSPDNILALMMGPYLGTGAPCSGRFAAVTKSPLTGIFTSSSCGGPFGMSLKTAGYDGLLVRGKASEPIIIRIDDQGVRFESAGELWGKTTSDAQAELNLPKKAAELVIGPAGEHCVWFANVRSGNRYIGRGGVGAVMGSKRVKAIVAQGGVYKIEPADGETFQKIKRRAVNEINRNDFTSNEYRKYGTLANVKFCNENGIMPVQNFQAGSDPRAQYISGEAYAETYKTLPKTCHPCSILCGHKGKRTDGSELKIPEYESAILLGPNLGVFDRERIVGWNDLCNDMGLDTISTGGTLGWAMEAGERGLLKTDVSFGQPNGISETITALAHRQGIGDDLANGSRWLSKKYGGEAFAMQVKGLELAAYDPRGSWGQGLSYAVANRGGCHLSATSFAIEVFVPYLNRHSTQAKARVVQFFENLYDAVNSLQTCQFTGYAHVTETPIPKYTPLPIMQFAMRLMPALALQFIDIGIYSQYFKAITGIKMTPRQFMRAGARIHNLERYMNTREGISRVDDTLPGRILNEGRSDDPSKRTVPLDKMLDQYYAIRGWDKNGIPTARTLDRLGIKV